MPTKCSVFHCNNPSVAKDLCATHYKRQARHGSVDQTRPDDWGAREKHPAYKAWCGLRRYHFNDMPIEWKNDFWNFAKSVPEKTSEKSRAFRPNKNLPWSSDNFYWQESRVSDECRKDRAAYMRNWMNKTRENNKNYFKSVDLKKLYGVNLQWYNAQLERQNGKCAICENPETAQIRGKTLALAVDHCHATGKVRELLCRACNNAIGALDHDPNLLREAADYLERHTSAPDKNGA